MIPHMHTTGSQHVVEASMRRVQRCERTSAAFSRLPRSVYASPIAPSTSTSPEASSRRDDSSRLDCSARRLPAGRPPAAKTG